jgi:ABC-2 type transport system permease protein
VNNLSILINREVWEHRNAFLIVPAIITSFFLVMLLLFFSASLTDMLDVKVEFGDHEKTDLDQHLAEDNHVTWIVSKLVDTSAMRRDEVLDFGFQMLSMPLSLGLWLVMFFYLLACLYDERRDRSILFWKSMPVSDGMTVLAKLVTGVLFIPLIYLVCIAILQFLALIMLSLVSFNSETSATEMIWTSSGLVGNWMSYIGVILFYSAWSLPFFAWLMLVSAAARSLPLAWALGVPAALALIERLLVGETLITDWAWRHVFPIGFLLPDQSSADNLIDRAWSIEMLSAIFLGIFFLFSATWFRKRAREL